MINKQKQILFTLVLLMACGISSVYAQSTSDFSGTWNTVTSKGKKLVITLASVRRTSVTGYYGINGLTGSYNSLGRPDNIFMKVSAVTAVPAMQNLSSIRGTVTDNVLRFKWFEEGSHGAGRFAMSSDGLSFEGTFSLTDNPDDTSGGTWNGTRAPNFAGAWSAKLGDGVMELILQQTGVRVTGQIRVNSADLGTIREGIIDGNTLRFKIWRARSTIPNAFPDQYVGRGELIIDKGSKSFKGTILGTSTSGTRLGR